MRFRDRPAANAACASPTGNAGDKIYNAVYHVPQYCNGSTWVAMGSPGLTVPTQGLVGWWKLDDGSGTNVPDSSGNGFTALVRNETTPNWSTGQINGALTLPEVSGEHVLLTNMAQLSLAGPWTISSWVNLTALPASGGYYALITEMRRLRPPGHAVLRRHALAAARVEFTLTGTR